MNKGCQIIKLNNENCEFFWTNHQSSIQTRHNSFIRIRITLIYFILFASLLTHFELVGQKPNACQGLLPPSKMSVQVLSVDASSQSIVILANGVETSVRMLEGGVSPKKGELPTASVISKMYSENCEKCNLEYGNMPFQWSFITTELERLYYGIMYSSNLQNTKPGNGGIIVRTVAGLSYAVGDFSRKNNFAKNGYQAGLHIDKMWNNFGLGLYGGFDKNNIKYTDLLPANLGADFSRLENFDRNDWRQFSAGIGPVFRLGVSKKLNIELTSKLGFSKFMYPDFSKSLAVSAPLNTTYNLYETRHENIEKKLNPMLMSVLRLNYNISRGFSLSLASNFKHVRDIKHAYSYLDGDFSTGMSNDELIQSLQNAPTVYEVRKCRFNTVGVTLGLSFHFGGKPEQGIRIEPPQPKYPENGATISEQEADTLLLIWNLESPMVKKANYNLWLWKTDETERMADSLILKTKVTDKGYFTLPKNIKLITGNTYKWRVRAVDDKVLKACLEDCYSMESTFKVGVGSSIQYYQLLTENSGNYIEVKGQLRVKIPMNMMLGGNINGRIFNQKNDEILRLDDLSDRKAGEAFTLDEQGRLTLQIDRFPNGYYVFILTTENKRTYYFRFQILDGNEHK